MKIQSVFIILLCTLLSTIAQANVDVYSFTDETLQKRYQSFTEELRCPKCQNQNLADSNSPISSDLRRELYNLLEAGKTDQEIVDFMVSRYGDYVLYRPKLQRNTFILWGGPFAIAVVALLVLFFIVRRRPAKSSTVTMQQSAEPSEEMQKSLTTEEKQRLSQLLADNDNNKSSDI